MTGFTVKLADVPVRIDAIHPQTEQFLRDYRCEEAPAFSLEMRQEDLDAERVISAESRERDGLPPLEVSDRYLETLAIYRKLAERMVEENVLLFHGSVVAVDGEGYLFAARSGTGKSTHAALWRQAFGDRAVMVNDDKPLLRVTENGVLAYGTPWDGKHHLSENRCVPLKGLCILERAEQNRIAPISANEAFPDLYMQCYRPQEPERMMKVLDLLEQLSRKTRLYRLGCNMEPEAAIVSYNGMQEEEV